MLRPPRTKRHRTNRSIRTEQAYVDWIKRYILFHNKPHPKEMDSREIEAFLTYVPFALQCKYHNANREWIWQYVFPAAERSKDPRTGAMRRHHLHESSLQKAVRKAGHLSGINKSASVATPSATVLPRTYWRAAMTPLVLWHLVLYPVPVGPGQVRPKYRAQGQRVRTVQELLGHKDVRTTMIYTLILSKRRSDFGSLRSALN